jgi:DNA-binding beta-propeller fold protein YncE
MKGRRTSFCSARLLARGSRFGAIGYLAFLAFGSACIIGAPQAPAQAQTIVTLGGGFHTPPGVAVDGSGNVFVADADNNAVKEIPASCYEIGGAK